MKEIHRLEKIKAQQDAEKGELRRYSDDITELFSMADEEHKFVVEFANKANEAHEKITAMMEEVTNMIREANKNHAAFVAAKEKADEFHQKGLEMREKVMASKREKYDEQRAARQDIVDQNKSVRAALLDKEKLDKAADDAFQQLLKKGKVAF